MPRPQPVGDDDQESPAKYLTAIITAQPVDQVGVIGGDVSFTFSFAAVIPAEFTFQWQIQTDGATWGDLVETAGYYEGVSAQVLHVKALDNFLATRTSRNFRCKLLFAGSVPTFTDQASLSIPVYVDWSRPSFPQTNVEGNSGIFQVTDKPLLANAILPHGFSGPYNYNWAQIGGTAGFLFTGAADPSRPIWAFNNPPLGPLMGIFQATIDNGSTSVVSDPYYAFMFGVVPFDFVTSQTQLTTPEASIDGGEIFAPPGSFLGPWSIIEQQNIRRGVTPAATLTSAATANTAFSLNGPNIPGTCVSVMVWAPGTTGFSGAPRSLFSRTEWFG